MVHMILLILKILGIAIAVIVGLVLLCICIVLFVPVRYRAKGEYDTQFCAEGHIWWLCHLVSIRVRYPCGDAMRPQMVVRIFGYRFFDSERNEKKSSDHTKAKQKDRTRQTSGTPESSGRAKPGPETVKEPAAARTADTVKEPAAARTADAIKEPAAERTADTAKGPAAERMLDAVKEPDAQKDAVKSEYAPVSDSREEGQQDIGRRDRAGGFWSKAGGKAARLWRKAVSMAARLKAAVLTLFEKLRGTGTKADRIAQRLNILKAKKDAVLTVLFDEKNRPAFLKLKAVLLKVLRHLKPLKLSAAVRFGFDDPASTGYTLGVLSLLYPVFEEHVQLYPDFEQTIFEGWFKVAGRIRASVFLTAACRLILDKNIRRVILALKNI